jgi:hypothetical protein
MRLPHGKAAVAVGVLFLFVTAATFEVVHPLDFKAHQDGKQCSLCLSMASLDGACVGQPIVFAADHTVASAATTLPTALISAELPRQSARGPPSAS